MGKVLGQWNSLGLTILRGMNHHFAVSQRAMERISTGMRINRASDDPAGLAISEKMRAQIRGLNMAGRNIQDGISLLQTAEGGMNEMHSILQRMRELSVQAANDTNTDSDRQALDSEFQQLKDELGKIASGNQFNSMPLLDGSKGSFSIQTGANANQSIELSIGNLKNLGLGDVSLISRDAASEAISKVDEAIKTVSSERSKTGAYMNRLEHAYSNAMSMSENLAAAESRIRDADLAKEIMEMTKAQILLQANQYVMRLHMQQAQNVLQLLQPPRS